MPNIVKQSPPAKGGGEKPAPPNGKAKPELSLFDAAVPVEQMPNTGYKFLIFGLSGTGKTTLGCDFPKPLLLIRPEEVEDGSRSVRRVAGVQVTPPLTDPDQLIDICEGQRRTRRYRSIVLDGVTRLQDHVVKKHLNLNDVPVQLTWGMVPQADWNRIGIMLKDFLRELLRLTELETHIIIVGGERVFGDEEGAKIQLPRTMVALTPGMTGWLHEMCDFNVHTFTRPQLVEKITKSGGKELKQKVPTGNAEFCLHIGPGNTDYAVKFRVPRESRKQLPQLLVDPSFAKMQALIEGD